MAKTPIVKSICIKVEKGSSDSIWNEVERTLTVLGLNFYEHVIDNKGFCSRKKVYLFSDNTELTLADAIVLMQKFEEIFKIRFFTFDPTSSKFSDHRFYPEPTMLIGIGTKEIKTHLI